MIHKCVIVMPPRGSIKSTVFREEMVRQNIIEAIIVQS